MISLIEALNYRCLRYVSRPLNPFHVLVGPNASGKTTFLDVVGFLRDLVSGGLDTALSQRTANPEELLYRRQGDRLELAIEVQRVFCLTVPICRGWSLGYGRKSRHGTMTG